VLSEAILNIEDAENILVIKTVPGMAMGCAAAIDSISIQGIVGCIAGDDTIMCVVKQVSQVPSVIGELEQIIKGAA
jgi:transcriptional regulator of arginine metabolism